jgi:hypothetical protein
MIYLHAVNKPGARGEEPGGHVEGFGRLSGAVPVETGIGSGYNCCEEVKKISPPMRNAAPP